MSRALPHQRVPGLLLRSESAILFCSCMPNTSIAIVALFCGSILCAIFPAGGVPPSIRYLRALGSLATLGCESGPSLAASELLPCGVNLCDMIHVFSVMAHT